MADFVLVPKHRKWPRPVYKLFYRQLRLHYRINKTTLEALELDLLIYGRNWYETEMRDIQEFLPKAPREQIAVIRRIEPANAP